MKRAGRAALALALIVVPCGKSSSSSSSEPPPAIAIVDATVIPMDPDGALPHQTVIVRGDRIEAVGPVASTPVPAGATTIDGKASGSSPASSTCTSTRTRRRRSRSSCRWA